MEEGRRRLHRTLVEAVLTSGTTPDVATLTDRLEMAAEAVRTGLAALAAADYLACDAAGRVVCLYPFSVAPTTHVALIDGQRRYAMCAIDALGIPVMLQRELSIEGRCAVCATAIEVRVKPGAILSATPPATLVVARRDETEPAFAACCPFTVFMCGQEHADTFLRRIDGAHALTLAAALARAEGIFGGLLTDVLPATRPRGQTWLRPHPD
jgi:hypothetical protein